MTISNFIHYSFFVGKQYKTINTIDPIYGTKVKKMNAQ
ncbi:hypothetical protein EFD32_1965 [Enterococcus faecalis D32]|nr:hypothetical protein EFD32_1965 [Enterococcus faecalis D32]